VGGLLTIARRLSRALHRAGAAALAAMMLLTVADVVLRSLRHPIVGTYELVGFLGALAIGFALPQTSLDGGQVLMDFLARHLPAGANRALSVATRAIGVALFAVLGWNLAAMGVDLRRTGDVTPLLNLPLAVPAFAIALACGVECLVLVATAVPTGDAGGNAEAGGAP
jgi:TRAP-type C4-dicarboxylate transport system permease small subunit